MRIFGVFLGVWLASVAGAFGQVEVEVVLDQQQFLPGESLPIAVRITNRSGQTLKLGGDDEWLSVGIQAESGGVVHKLADPPVKGEFTLESSQRGTRMLDLAPCYNLTRQGRYLVQATVKIEPWGQQFTSAPEPFNIITGARLWEREVGLPQGDTNSAPEVRKFILEQANYLKRNLRLYLRLTDATETRVYRVLAIGPMVSFGQPEPRLDRRSNLHVLYQYGRNQFAYLMINPDGEILLRQTHEITETRPRLRINDEGEIRVVGGTRRSSKDDFPPAPARETEPQPADAAPAPKPAPGTNDNKTAIQANP